MNATPSAPLRAALYCRISEKEEGVDKTANQEAALRILAAQHGYEVQGVYTDDDISAYRGKLERPAWTRMLSAIREGRVDVVMAVAPDRFTRGSAAEVEALSMLCASAGAVIHTKSTGVQDPASPMVRAMLAIQDVFNGLTVDVMRQKQQDRIEAELAKGNPLWGNRIFGFQTDRRSLVETEAEAIREAYRRILDAPETLSAEDQGHAPWTLYKVAKDWNARGFRTTDRGRTTKRGGKEFVHDGLFTSSAVRTILSNPRMAGILMHKGAEVASDGLPAVVSRERFEAMRAVLNDPARKPKRGQKPVHLLSGVLRCPCGQTLNAGIVRTRRTVKGVEYAYLYEVYRCRRANTPGNSSGHATVRIEEADEWVTDEVLRAIAEERVSVSAVGHDPESLAEVYSALSQNYRALDHLQGLMADPDLADDLSAFKSRAKALRAERQELEAQRDRLLAASAQGGALAEFLAYMQGLPDYSGVEASIGAGSTPEQRAAFWAPAIGWAQGWEAWHSTPVEKRREILRGSFRVDLLAGRAPVQKRVRVEPV